MFDTLTKVIDDTILIITPDIDYNFNPLEDNNLDYYVKYYM